MVPAEVRRFERAVAAALRGPCGILPPARRGRGPADAPPRLLVAVSGGQDSLALLHALARLGRGPGHRRPLPLALTVAYFDHGLRPPAETAAERDFVAAQAAALGVPFVAAAGDTRAAARREGRSLEDAARRLRYAFLRDAARDADATAVATGHTATDQAETVLLRLLRGTGVAGLGAMDWRAPWPLGGAGPALVRPLLGLRREQTGAYCAALGLGPRHDPENDSARYRRNRLRRELLPALMQFNPRVVEALTGLAASARESERFIAEALDARWREVARVDPDGVTLARDRLAALPPALRTAALRRAVALLNDDRLPPARAHLDALASLVTGAAGRGLSLPGGVRAEATAHGVYLRRPAVAPWRLEGEWPLPIGRETRLPGWRAQAEHVAAAAVDPHDLLTAWLRPEVAAGGMLLTGRRPGDRIQPLGMAGTKKVQDLLVDARVPRSARDHIPILRCDGRVAWVVGVRLSGWAAAAPGAPAVRVRLRPRPSTPPPHW
jgi:tRNA(Ile)-lysidine synthetase-like protein